MYCTDKNLLAAGDCFYIVSNRHIKFQDHEKSSIIYPMGTAKFETLKIRLDKQKERTNGSTRIAKLHSFLVSFPIRYR